MKNLINKVSTIIIIFVLLITSGLTQQESTKAAESGTPRTGGAQSITADNLIWKETSPLDPLGGTNDFNAIFFDTFKNFHETGAPVAAKNFDNVNIVGFEEGIVGGINQFGNIKIPKYNVGMIAQNQVINKKTKVHNGDAVIGKSVNSDSIELGMNSGSFFVDENNEIEKFLSAAKSDFLLWHKKILAMKNTDTEVSESQKVLTLTLSEGTNIIELDGSSLEKEELHINYNINNEPDIVVIKVRGNKMRMKTLLINGTISFGTLDPIYNKIIWVMEDSLDEFTIDTTAVPGSILAPETNFKLVGGYSSINGTIIANGLESVGDAKGSEFHYIGRFTGKFKNLPTTKSLKVNKQWFNESNQIIPGDGKAPIKFDLFADGAVLKSGITLSQDNKWEHILEELPLKDENDKDIVYTIKEEVVPGYSSVITGDEEEGYIIKNKAIEKINVPVKKLWVGEGNHLVQDVTVKLLQDGKEIARAVLNRENSWSHTFKELYKSNEALVDHEYTIEELAVDGYSSKVTGTIKDGFVVTNTRHAIRNVQISKIWLGDRNYDEVSVDLYANGSLVKTQNLNIQNSWKTEFENVPVYDDKGITIIYTVKEHTMDGYVSNITGDVSSGFVITNTRSDKTEISVEKTWTGKKANQAQVVLSNTEGKVSEVTLDASNDWKHTFENLEMYDEFGVKVVYSIEEIAIKNYNTTISGENGVFIINNEYIPEKISIPVNKVWFGESLDSVTLELLLGTEIVDSLVLNKDNNWKNEFKNINKTDIDGNLLEYTVREVTEEGYKSVVNGGVDTGFTVSNTRFEETSIDIEKRFKGDVNVKFVKIQLLANGVLVQTIELNDENQWKQTIDNLDVYDNLGKEIEYTVEEVKVAGYSSSITGNKDTGFIITNTRSGLTSITVNKVWDGKQKEEIKITISNEDGYVGYATLNAATNWQYVFTNLPEYNDEGEKYEYTIVEESDSSYLSNVSKIGNKVTITNTYIPEKTSVSVNKLWLGEATDTVTVDLYLNISIVDTLVLNQENNWSGVFSKLDKTDIQGNILNYTVKERNLNGYISNIEGDQELGFTITNLRSELTSVSVNKKWIGKEGTEVFVSLYANNEFLKEVSLTRSNKWSYLFDNLEAFDENGEAISYTVKEKEIQNYVSNIDKTETGYEITNTYIPEKIEIPVNKKWLGEALDSVTIELLLDGKLVDSVLLNKSNNWKSTFKALDKTDINGMDLKYSVKEVTQDGYESDISGNLTDGFTITNLRSAEKDISITKKWVGDHTETSVTVELLNEKGEIVRTVDLKESNGWKHTFKGLPTYDSEGNYIKYEVVEKDVKGFTSTVTVNESFDSYTITNRTEEKTELKVTKKWIGLQQDSVKVILENSGKQIGEEVVLSEDNNWTHTFTDLPIFDEYDVANVYSVKELTEDSKFYDFGIPFEVSKNEYVITNTYIPELTEVKVNKVWNGVFGDNYGVDEIEVNLLRDGKSTGTSLKLNEANNWSGLFDNLTKTDIDGVPYIYEVTETPVAGYKSSIEINADNDFTIINTRHEFINIQVNKEWIGKKAESVTFDLIRTNANAVEEIILKGQLLNDDNNWNMQLHDISAFDAYGKPYSFKVVETHIAQDTLDQGNYNTRYEGNVEDGFTIINSYQADVFTNVTFNKEWVGGLVDQARPTIEIALIQTDVNNTEVVIERVTLVDPIISHIWDELLATDINGNPYTYTVKELTELSDYTQSGASGTIEDGFKITNTFVPNKTSFTANKKWVNGPDVKPDISLQLFKDGEVYGDAVVVKYPNTEHAWVDLDETDINGIKHIYTVDEVDTPLGYRKTVDKNTITNTFIIPMTSYEAHKIWVNGPDIKPDITLQLYRNGTPYNGAITLKSNVTSYTWEMLAETDNKGNKYIYTVDEVNVPNGYEKEVEGNKITNSYIIEKIDVKGSKTWINGPIEKPEIIINLLRDGIKFDSTRLKNNELEYAFTDLDKADEKGKLYIYTVEEEPIDEYIRSINGYDITNTYNSAKRSITVNKVWKDGPSIKPTIQVELLRNGIVYRTVSLANGKLSHTWDDLESKDDNGKLWNYTVNEKELKGYVTTIEGYEITNTYESDKVDFTVHKLWVEGPALKPTITVHLLQNGISIKTAKLENGTLDYTFTDLDKTDSSGVDYVYTVEEEALDGYTTEIQGNRITNTFIQEYTEIEVNKIWVGGPEVKPNIHVELLRNGKVIDDVILSNGTVSYIFKDLRLTDNQGNPYKYEVTESQLSNYATSIDGTTITNTYRSPKTQLRVDKVWVGGPLIKPTIEITLLRNDIGYRTVKLENGDLFHVFEDLDLNDMNGNPYVYKLVEKDVENYESVVNGSTIRNTYVSPKVNITTNKTWINGPEIKPSIEISLYRDDKLIDSVYLKNGELSHIWTDLPKTDNNGVAYSYTVKETSIPGYISTVEGNDITNTYVSPLRDITVNKTWLGGSDIKPRIEIELLRDGVTYNTVTLENGSSSYTWKDLPETDDNGLRYSYTVKEKKVENYETKIEDLDIINTYISPKTKVDVTKNWLGGPEIKPEIEVNLLRDGIVIDAVILENGNTKHTFDNLDLTDRFGRVYEYSVREKNIPNYISTVNGTELTNIYKSPLISIPVTKTWVNGPDLKPDIEIELLKDGAVIDVITLENGKSRHIWTNLDEMDTHGVKHLYTVREKSVDNYYTEVNGYDIKNTYVSSKTEISINKIWIGGPDLKPEIQINLFRNGTYVQNVILEDGETSHTFKDLDITDSKGNPYTYTVKEKSVENYDSKVDGFEITNTYISPKTEITVNKIWVDGPKVKPEIEINLLRDSETIQTITLENGETSYTFKNLDLTDDNGKEYVYTVTENHVENYDTEIVDYEITNTYQVPLRDITVNKKWIGGPSIKPEIEVDLLRGDELIDSIILKDGELSYTWKNLEATDLKGVAYDYKVMEKEVSGYDTEIDGFNITNTYRIPITEVTVNKTWIGGSTIKPDIEIELLRNDVVLDTQTLVDGQLTYTWDNLFGTDENGNVYKYTVNEKPIENYATDIKGFDIVNTYISPKTEVRVNKTWVGGPSIKPEIEIDLLRDGKVIDTVILKDGQLSHTFEDLDLTNTKGVDHVYTVLEKDVAGYEKSANGTELTNTFIIEKLDIDVKKIWVGTPLETITVNLLANGNIQETITLDEDKSWTHTFKNLVKLDENFEEIVYTIEEIQVDSYDTNISGNVDSGFIITNTENIAVSDPNKTSVSVNKKWNGVALESVTINLHANDEFVESRILDAAGNWEITFTGLDKYDSNNNEITYSISEVLLPGYESFVIKNSEGDFTVFNNETGVVGDVIIGFTVDKIWTGKIGEAVTVDLYANGELLEGHSKVLNAENNWSSEYKELPLYDGNNIEIVYHVEERQQAGYTLIASGNMFEGFILNNIEITPDLELGAVKVNKKWVGKALDSVTIHLLSNDTIIDSVFLSEDNNWMHTFSNLALKDTLGNPIVYTVEEKETLGYTTLIKKNSNQSFTIINTQVGKLAQTGSVAMLPVLGTGFMGLGFITWLFGFKKRKEESNQE